MASGKSTLVLMHSQYRMGPPHFSPNGEWILFLMLRSPGAIDIMLAPFRGATSVPEQDWITVTAPRQT